MDRPTSAQRMRDIQHFGEEGGVVPVIDVAATSTFLRPDDMERVFDGELAGCYLYSRHSNPTLTMFGQKLAAMDGAEAAIGVSSGMAAIACALEQICAPTGGHIVSSDTVYGGSYALFANIFPSRNISVDFVNIQDLVAVEKAIQPNTKAIYVETVSNPLLGIADLPRLKNICKKHNIRLVVDNTFTPLIVSPIEMGADVVVYSCTKYVSGASDMIAGAIVADRSFIDSLVDINHGQIMLTGPVMDPRIAHELYMRLDHLPLRMRGHSDAALSLARKLEEANLHPIYPGLESHSSHKTFKSQSNHEFGFGGMLTIDLGSRERAVRLAEKLQQDKFGLFAVSLGFSRTLMSIPASSTSSEIPSEKRDRIGLREGLLRISVGYLGDPEDMARRFFRCYQSL